MRSPLRLLLPAGVALAVIVMAQAPVPTPVPALVPAAPAPQQETVTPAVPASTAMTLILPTDNDALLRGKPEEFYMYVNRSFEGVESKPWEGGQYGYFRGPVRVGSQVVYMHFHEGIDIACQKRSEKGEPQDEVRSISDGEVVHVSDLPGASNYGRYIVVKHDWGEGPFYSLYAHLSQCLVKVGDKVKPGTPIAIMGHTGEGIDCPRSHTHLELNVMLNTHFGEWHDANYKDNPNHHGAYNGLNLAGMDIAALYLARQKNPALTVAQFLKTQTAVWKVVVPRRGDLELAQNYPWMGENLSQPSPSWEISFTDGGFPLKITPSNEVCESPRVSWVQDRGVPHVYYTRGAVSGSGAVAKLTGNGLSYVQLITGDFTRPSAVARSEKSDATTSKPAKKPAKKKKTQRDS
jgi:hypothetical protein